MSFTNYNQASISDDITEIHPEMSVDKLESIKKIENFNFDFLLRKFVESGITNEANFNNVVYEFKKFLTLVLLTNDPIAMLSRKVDELWHTFIIFTPQYRQFCDEVFGEFIDHQPHTEYTPVPKEAITNLKKAHLSVFNEEPDKIWFEDLLLEERESIENGVVPDHFQFKWSGWVGRNLK